CFRVFCRRFFTCEGGIMHEKNRRIPQIRISLWKHDKLINNSLNFMKDLGYFMKKYFNIDSTIKIQKNKSKRKDGVFTQSIKMYILNKSVIRFYNQIGFESEKQKSLKAILNSSFHGKPLD
ncbi:MAG: LAGLIDADG family homing endonuclease, partial [Nanoarchaeota archaeon]